MLDVLTTEPKVARTGRRTKGRSIVGPLFKDPLGEDHPSDEMRSITDRQLVRLLVVAAQVAARFEQERIDVDPIAWMLSPRRLFAGEAAIDVCHNLPAFKRAVVLHGLAVGMDADHKAIDDLLMPERTTARKPARCRELQH